MGKACAYCGVETSEWSGSPFRWPVAFPHVGDAPGTSRQHCLLCVIKRIRQRDEAHDAIRQFLNFENEYPYTPVTPEWLDQTEKLAAVLPENIENVRQQNELAARCAPTQGERTATGDPRCMGEMIHERHGPVIIGTLRLELIGIKYEKAKGRKWKRSTTANTKSSTPTSARKKRCG